MFGTFAKSSLMLLMALLLQMNSLAAKAFVVDPYEIRFYSSKEMAAAICIEYFDCEIAVIPITITGNGLTTLSRTQMVVTTEQVQQRLTELNSRLSEGRRQGKDIELTIPDAIYVNNLTDCAKDYPNSRTMIKFVEPKGDYDDSHRNSLRYLADRARSLETNLGETIYVQSFAGNEGLVVDPFFLTVKKATFHGRKVLKLEYFDCEIALVSIMCLNNQGGKEMSEEQLDERLRQYNAEIDEALAVGQDIQLTIPEVIYVDDVNDISRDYPSAAQMFKRVPHQNKYQNDLHYAYRYIKTKISALESKIKTSSMYSGSRSNAVAETSRSVARETANRPAIELLGF